MSISGQMKASFILSTRLQTVVAHRNNMSLPPSSHVQIAILLYCLAQATLSSVLQINIETTMIAITIAIWSKPASNGSYPFREVPSSLLHRTLAFIHTRLATDHGGDRTILLPFPLYDLFSTLEYKDTDGLRFVRYI